MENKDIRVCVGLSGGVDSSVAALLLKRQGYDVFALFMQNWNDASTTLHGDCEWEEDRFVAEMVARKIGIPFYFVDLSKEYRKRVVDYMFEEYSRGRTPNPDVLCNREIKFDAFLKCALKLGADMVATGHYCRKELCVDRSGQPVQDAAGRPVYRLLAGSDPDKDQSYFLCQLNQEQLSRALFPIGDIVKPEVRRLAREADLPSADKKDSQGICFIGKVDLPTFLQQVLRPAEGDVVEVYDAYYADNGHYRFCQDVLRSLYRVDCDEASGADGAEVRPAGDDPVCAKTVHYDQDRIAALPDEQLVRLSEPVRYDIAFETETYRSGKRHIKKTRYRENPFGKIVGRHDGAQFYTVGQRKGLNIGGHREPLFVIDTDVEKNIIYVGEGGSHKGLYRSCLRIMPEDIHWIHGDLEMGLGEIRRYRVRIRYRQPLQDAFLVRRASGMFILFDRPQRGITSGQFAVWYDGDELCGSGPIV